MSESTTRTKPSAGPSSSREKWTLLLAVVFGIYGALRTALTIYSLWHKTLFAHDLHIQYEPWLLLIDRKTAASALQTLTYLPHTWILLTPIYALGWRAAEAVWFLLNCFFHIYIWHTLCTLAGLRGHQRWLFLALYFSQESVGLSLALGNPIIACMAATVAACAATNSRRSGLFFALAAIKHSVAYPLYLRLILQRSAKVLPVILFTGVSLLAAMWWAHVGPAEMLSGLLNGARQTHVWMHETGSVSFVPAFEEIFSALHAPSLAQPFAWALWAVLFWIAMKVKDPLAQLAALLLIGLLPMQHRSYDLVVVTPLLALLIRKNSLLLSSLITLTLCGLWDAVGNRFAATSPWVWAGCYAYYPMLIIVLFFIAVAFGREAKTRPAPATAAG